MLNRIVVGTNQLKQAGEFYDQVLSPLGMTRVLEQTNGFAWANSNAVPTFAVFIPFNKSAATTGNGSMVAFKANTKKLVDLIYNEALANGGTDAGAPGERSSGFYAGYFRDLDDNKICICNVDLTPNDIEKQEKT